jgi:predicted transcriptional regulator
VTNQDIRDFAQSNPAVARAVMRLFDKYRHLAGAGATAELEDGAEGPYHRATDAISDFLQENANYFPELEAAAERVREDIDNAADSFEAGLRTWLGNVFGLDWRLASLPHGIARRLAPNGRMLELTETIPPQSALFAVCHHVGSLAADTEIAAIVERANLPEGDAPALARNVLASYFAAALIMPYRPFLEACQQTRYDIDRLARRFGASFEQVCHRMTTLQRPGALGIPFHLVRTDIAGNISKRFSLSGIHIPRHAGACPRWNVHAAFLNPGRINIQISQMPNGDTFFCIARSLEKDAYRYNAPRRHFAIGLGCDIAHAKRLVYSDGIDLGNTAQIVPIGTSCRICPRMDCEHRAHPPADYRFQLDTAEKAVSLYGRMAR